MAHSSVMALQIRRRAAAPGRAMPRSLDAAAVAAPVHQPGVTVRAFHLVAAFAVAIALWGASVTAQVPPRNMNPYVLIDPGPVAAPACSCIAHPFAVPTPRPGWGYGEGPAAPSEDATPSDATRTRQELQDAEDRAELPHRVKDALAGNGNASLLIAQQLLSGTPGPMEYAQAARWMALAASQGHPDAFIRLAHMYRHGIGVAQDDKTAAYWFRAGATHGDKYAMVALGLLYAAGRGVTQDWSVGAQWWARAAAGGLPIASRYLGDAYACGLGVELDQERAVAEYRRSAAAGEMSSSVQLGHMYRSGCARAADEEMVAAYEKAADRGDPEAQIALSALFFEGRGVDQSFYRAYHWARLAERRLPPGDLRGSAAAHAAKAAHLLSAFERQEAETMLDALLAAAATPMR